MLFLFPILDPHRYYRTYKDKNLSGVHTIIMDKPIRYKTDESSYIINKLEGTFTHGSLDKEVKVYKDNQLIGEIFYVYG